MRAFAEALAPAHLFAALRAGEPLAEVARHRVPSSRWRRYESRWRRHEKMRRFPAARTLAEYEDALTHLDDVHRRTERAP